MCPHCQRKWYKKTGDRINGVGKQYYSCECLICHQYFDMEQWWYNHHNKKMRRLGNEDRDVAELLIKKEECIFCGEKVVKGGSKLPARFGKNNAQRIIESEIFHCKNPKCEKSYYIPKSMYDDIKKVS